MPKYRPRKPGDASRLFLLLEYNCELELIDPRTNGFYTRILDSVLPLRRDPIQRYLALAAVKIYRLYKLKEARWTPGCRTMRSHFNCPPPNTQSLIHTNRCYDSLCPFCWATLARKRYAAARMRLKRAGFGNDEERVMLTFHVKVVKTLADTEAFLKTVHFRCRQYGRWVQGGLTMSVVTPLLGKAWRVEHRTLLFLDSVGWPHFPVPPNQYILKQYTPLRFQNLFIDFAAFDSRLLYPEHPEDYSRLVLLRQHLQQRTRRSFTRFGSMRSAYGDKKKKGKKK